LGPVYRIFANANLAASCPNCQWADNAERAVTLADAGKLTCWKCGATAILVYIPSLRSSKVSAGVHEEVASGQKADK
jgi:hypothetical protein